MSEVRNRQSKEAKVNFATPSLDQIDLSDLDPTLTVAKLDRAVAKTFSQYTALMSGVNKSFTAATPQPQTGNPDQYNSKPSNSKLRATRSTVKKGLTRLISPGSQRRRNRRKKAAAQEASKNSEQAPPQEDAPLDQAAVDPEEETAETNQEPPQDLITGWTNIPDGRGLFNSAKQEKTWFEHEVKDKLPLANPQQLISIGINRVGEDEDERLYSPGEGLIVHMLATYYSKLNSIGYHLGIMKVFHRLLRKYLTLEEDDDEITENNILILKDLGLKHTAFVVGGLFLPKGAESHKVLTDFMNATEICDRIDDVSELDQELYIGYNALAHLIELPPEEREKPPEVFKYAYLVQLFVDAVAVGGARKEYIKLSFDAIYSGESSVPFFAKIATALDSPDEEEPEDAEGPLPIKNAESSKNGKESNKDSEDAAGEKNWDRQKKSAGGNSTGSGQDEEDDDDEEENIEITDTTEEDAENEEDEDAEESDEEPVKKQGVKKTSQYITKDMFVGAMKLVNSKLTTISSQYKELMKNQTTMMEQLGSFDTNFTYAIGRLVAFDLAHRDIINAGQRANQADPIPESRKARTDKITERLMKKKVTQEAKNVIDLDDEDDALIKLLSKQTVHISEMEKVLSQVKSRLKGTPREVVAATLTAKKLLNKLLRNRIVEVIKETPKVGPKAVGKKRKKTTEKTANLDDELDELLAQMEAEEEDAAGAGPSKKMKK